jgi:hypothetical protein
MIAGLCVAIMFVALFSRGFGRGPAPLEHDDLIRLRRMKERLQREDVHPFE